MPRSHCRITAPALARVAVLALLGAVVAGCRGDKIATVSLAAPGTGEARFQGGKSVRLWSDWSGEWMGASKSSLPLAYDVEVLQAGAVVGKITCDTKSPASSVCSGGSYIFGKRTGSCEDLLKCEMPDTKPGEVTIRVTGRLLGNPATTKIEKMNLNVRAN